MNGAKATTTRKKPIIRIPSSASGLRNRRRRQRGALFVWMVLTGTSVIADPWVDQAVEQVHQQVDDNEGNGDQQNRTLDRGIVAGQNGLHQQSADARPGEDGFSDDSSCQ